MAAIAFRRAHQPKLTTIPRPSAETRFWGWISTVDHKRIGILDGSTAFISFLVAGVEATIMRLQLARPNHTLVDAS